MNRQLLTYVGAGLVLVAIGVAIALFLNRGSHADLEGKILKARVISTDEQSATILFDFRFQNGAKVPFMVSEVTIACTPANGDALDGMVIAQMDIDRLLDYHKLAGPRYNPVIVTRERFAPGTNTDRTAAASFPLPAAQLEARKGCEIRIGDVDGNIAVIREVNQ